MTVSDFFGFGDPLLDKLVDAARTHADLVDIGGRRYQDAWHVTMYSDEYPAEAVRRARTALLEAWRKVVNAYSNDFLEIIDKTGRERGLK